MNRSKPTPATDQLGIPALLAFFLVPGALMPLAFVVVAPIVESTGFPPLAALLVAILPVLIPIELGIVLRAGRCPPPADPVGRTVPPAAAAAGLGMAPPTLDVFLAFVGFGVSMVVEPAVIDALFGSLPHWSRAGRSMPTRSPTSVERHGS